MSVSQNRPKTQDPPEPPTLTVSFFTGKTDNRPKVRMVPWPDLARRLTTHEERAEKDGPLWSPASYNVGARRANDQVQAVCAAVFDFDHGPPPREHLALLGHARVLYTTHSHLVACKDNETGDPRWRLVVPLSRPVPAKGWYRFWLRLRAYLAPGAVLDEGCKEASRMYYEPACRPGAPRYAEIIEGPFLDPDAVPELSPEDEAKASAPAPPVGERIVHPNRHPTLTSLAGSMRRRGMSEAAMAAALLVENEQKCDPPLPEADVRHIAKSVARYEPAAAAPASGAPPDDGAPHPAETGTADPPENSGEYRASSGDGRRTGPYQEGKGDSGVSGNSGQGEAEWGAPEPLTAEILPAFPTDALPAWLQTYVEALAEATQTPVDLAALMSLGALSATAGGRVKVWVRSTWQEPVNLYVSPAQESGNRKSAVVREVTAPIRDWERRREKENRPDVAAAQSRRRVAEQALEVLEARAAKASDPGERAALLAEAEQAARQLEVLPVAHTPRLLTEDCTPERLAGLMAEQGGRMAILSPEGDVYDIMAGRYSSEPNFGIFLKGHAGDPHHVDRQGRPAEYIAEPALTIAVSPQPEVLAGLAEKPSFRGRGMLARVLYSLPASLLGRRSIHPADMPDTVRETYQKNVAALLERFQTVKPDAGGGAHHYAKPDPEAAAALDDFLAWVEPQLGPHGELAALRDWGGKLAGAVVRIAALLHLAEQPTDPAAWKAQICHDVMQRAVRIGKYLIPHARAAYDLMGLDTDTGNARLILDWIVAKRKERFTKREAYQAHKGRFKVVAEVETVLQLLEERGYVRREVWERPKGQRGQPPSPVYVVNPTALVVSAVHPSHNSQKPQNSSVPDSDGVPDGSPQNSHDIPQNSAPAWPGAADRLNGHTSDRPPAGTPCVACREAGSEAPATRYGADHRPLCGHDWLAEYELLAEAGA